MKPLLRACAWVIEASLEGMFLVSHEWPARHRRAASVLGSIALALFAVISTPIGGLALLVSKTRRQDVAEAIAEKPWSR